MLKKASSRLPEFLSGFTEYSDSLFFKLFLRSKKIFDANNVERFNIFDETNAETANLYSSIYGLGILELSPYRGLLAQLISEKMFGTSYSYTLPFYMLGYSAALFLIDKESNQINIPGMGVTSINDYQALLRRMYIRWDSFDWSDFFGGTPYNWDNKLRWDQQGAWDLSNLNYVRGRRFVAVDPSTPLTIVDYYRTNMITRNTPVGSKCDWGYFYHPSMIPFFDVPNYKIKDLELPSKPLSKFSILEISRDTYKIEVDPFSKVPLSYLISDEIENNYIGSYNGGRDEIIFKTVGEGYNYRLTTPSDGIIKLNPGDLKKVGINSFVEFKVTGEIVVTLGYIKDSQEDIGKLKEGEPVEGFDLPIYYTATLASRNFLTFLYEGFFYKTSPVTVVEGDEGSLYVYVSTDLGIEITYNALLNIFKISRGRVEKVVCNYTKSVDSDQRGDFLISWNDKEEIRGIAMRSIDGELLGTFTEFSVNKNQRMLLFSDGVAPRRGSSDIGRARNGLSELQLGQFNL